MRTEDRERLEKYLERKLEARGLSITSVWQNLEGWSMETFSLGLSYKKDGKKVEREIILRREPIAGLLEPYDVSIEHRVISAFNKTSVAVPKTLWYEPDPEVFERPFYTMEKVEGYVHFWKMNADPNWRLIPDDNERESLGADFVENISGIHHADWKSLGLDFLGVPGPGKGSAALQLEKWTEVIERAGFGNKPAVAYSRHWLADHLPENDRVTVVHGDYRTGNYIARDGRIAAVLDWEMVHLGDPMEDISYIIGTAWRSPRPHLWVSHLMPKQEFFDKYEEKSGIKIDQDRLKFYHNLNNYKGVGIGATAANAFKTKGRLDLKPGVFGMTIYIQLHLLMRTLNKYVDL